jgi:hypothetical protein
VWSALVVEVQVLEAKAPLLAINTVMVVEALV